MLVGVVEAISRPFASLFEKTGSGMEPESLDLAKEDTDESIDRQHLFRLFVGWVPKLFTEQDLLPLFQKYGDVKDIIILKDKVSNQPRGCAFVSYATKEEAEAAIHALDKGVHLPGALCPMEVRFARSHQYVPAGQGPQDNRQLFFTRAPISTTEEELVALFSRFGQVVEINLFRERRTHLSKGCGFVAMATREQAMSAMQALDEKHLLEGSVTPLAVKWADPELQIKKRRAVEDSNAENRMLFFAKVLRSANEDEVKQLFIQYGRVVEVNLFRAFQGAPTTKGCGLVTMGSNDEAAAAIEALDNKHIWDGMEAPMVVKWMDAALQKRRREEHLAAMRQGLVPSMSMSTDVWSTSSSRAGTSGGAISSRSAGLSQGKLLEAAAASAAASKASSSGEMAAAAAAMGVGSGGALPAELPPVGCAADAYKLFVGNIPKHYTEEELRPIFQQVGHVVELVVVRDKFTHESKGSAFVWYSTRQDADNAVLQFNLCRLLHDPTGEQTRPLVVRRANMRKPATAMMLPLHSAISSGGGVTGQSSSSTATTMGMMSGATSGGGMATGSRSFSGVLELSMGGMAPAPLSLGSAEVPLHLQPMGMQVQQQQQQPAEFRFYQAPAAFPTGASTLDSSASGNLVLASQISPAANTVNAMLTQQQSLQLRTQQPAAPQQQQQPQTHYIIATGGQMLAPQQQHVTVAAGPAAAAAFVRPAGAVAAQARSSGGAAEVAMGPVVQMSMQLIASQMSLLTSQLYNIASMSGAEINTIPMAGGIYIVNLTGQQSQVESARQVVGSLLSQLQVQGIM